MMRVLFLVEDAKLNGGTEILARNLASALNESAVECRLVSAADLRARGNLKREIAREARAWRADWIINHTYDICQYVPTEGPWKTAQVFNWSLRGYEAAYLSGVSAKQIFKRILSRVKFEIKRWRWHRALPKFTKLVSLTDAGKEELLTAHSDVRAPQMVTIPDPLMQTKDAKVISSLDNKRLVFVGRLSGEKGVMRLLRIWKRISEELPDYKLAIYGKGQCQAEMEAYITEHQLRGVEFMGFCKDLEKIYTNADLCLMTSETEGFGMVLIEAMYYGVPCISFDCPVSPKEIIGAAGLTVPCFDENAYAAEVVKLLQDEERLAACQCAAVARARDFYINEVTGTWNAKLTEN